MEKQQYICPKCGCRQFVADRLQATKIFDVQNKRFTTVSCCQCGYTELYRQMDDSGMDVLDFLFGN